jgi:hypothetical protein
MSLFVPDDLGMKASLRIARSNDSLRALELAVLEEQCTLILG